MKKNYQKPTMDVVVLQYQQHLLDGSPFTKVDGNAGIKYGGGDNGSARSRSGGDWGDDWD